MAQQFLNLFEAFQGLFHNLPDHLSAWAEAYGRGFYLILFLIIFAETGLVVTPFLPGDSLLFATGALLAFDIPGLDLLPMIVLLVVAAVLGDLVNYHVGKWAASRLLAYEMRWLNQIHLDKTREFYNRHGGKTIILARFMPIVRTYAPFVAGMGGMGYFEFFAYNITGGIIWITSFLSLGYFFGNIPALKSNFQYTILAIIALSFAPLLLEYLRARRRAGRSPR
jgi:membrane-associated protein